MSKVKSIIEGVKTTSKWLGLPALGTVGSMLEGENEAASKSTAGANAGFNFLTLKEAGAARSAIQAAKAGGLGLRAISKIAAKKVPIMGLAFAAKDIYDIQKEGREAYSAGKEADRTAAYNQKNYGTIDKAIKTRQARSKVRNKLTGAI